jgi:class 3 adenylate cyclase
VRSWEAALVVVYLDLDEPDRAREWFDRLASADFTDIPKDQQWIVTLMLAAHAARRLGDARRAAMIYDILQPYAKRQVTVGFAFLCEGSAALSLGEAAATVGRWDDAERHFEGALSFDERTGTPPWLARTQYEYASMLHERGGPGDDDKAVALVNHALATAEELGMAKYVERALALKMELQGVPSTDFRSSIDAVAQTVQSERPAISLQPAPDGTVTIMFSDIENSTLLTERLGDQAWQDLLRKHNTLVRQQLVAYEGYEVKTMGDGFMVAFQSAKKGLDCAIAIQRAFAGRNAGDGEDVRVRIGLHAGEAIKEGDDFYGKNVVLASRVAGQAKGGEILVSSLIRQLVESSMDTSLFSEPREVELKGLTGTQRVFRVTWTPLGSK